MRINGDNLRQAIIDTIPSITDGGEKRKIVLVGHGLLWTELAVIKSLDIALDDLGVVGLVDIHLLLPKRP